jgi:hypothetical protein
MVLIPGMFHADIGDTGYIFARPLGTLLGITGPADWRRTHATINAYSLAFFDKYLKSQLKPLLHRPSQKFPEVIFERRRLPRMELKATGSCPAPTALSTRAAS